MGEERLEFLSAGTNAWLSLSLSLSFSLSLIRTSPGGLKISWLRHKTFQLSDYPINTETTKKEISKLIWSVNNSNASINEIKNVIVKRVKKIQYSIIISGSQSKFGKNKFNSK